MSTLLAVGLIVSGIVFGAVTVSAFWMGRFLQHEYESRERFLQLVEKMDKMLEDAAAEARGGRFYDP